MVRLVLPFAFAFLASFGGPALAASFDCAKAATPFEHAICDDPELSADDEVLAKSYATAIGGLSEAALGGMRSDQRAWLDFARRACTLEAKPIETGRYDESGVQCLRNLFSARSGVLEQSRMISGQRFFLKSQFRALPDLDAVEDAQPSWLVGQHELNYVQLDAEAGFAQDFNAFVEAEALALAGLSGTGDGEDIAQSGSSDQSTGIFVDDVAGTRRITLALETYWYGHGAAHGNWARTYLHYLPKANRALVAEDVFAGSEWQAALLDLAVEALETEHGDALMLDNKQDIAQAVIDPARWDLSDPYALVLQFQPYEVSAYAYGAPSARISWEKLAPYLDESGNYYR